MAVPVTIGTRPFPTKKAARDFIRKDVIAAHDGAPQIPFGPIHDFVEDLLALHTEATEKIGPGIDYFRVDPASKWKVGVPVKASNRTLVVVRIDGSEIDWSWDGIITNPTVVGHKQSALRNAIYPRIQALKLAAFSSGPVTCSRTGVLIANPNHAKIRYISPSFAQLADGFAATVGGWGAIDTSSSGAGAEISDPGVKAAWITYYDANVVPSIEVKP